MKQMTTVGIKIRVLVPHDPGFASGGMGPLTFPFNILAVLFTPWTWWSRFYERFIFPTEERGRIARGEAPTGYYFREFPDSATLKEVLLALDLDYPRALEGALEKCITQRQLLKFRRKYSLRR